MNIMKSKKKKTKINNSSLRTPLNRDLLSQMNEYEKNIYFMQRAKKNPLYPKKQKNPYSNIEIPNQIPWSSKSGLHEFGLVKENIVPKNCQSYDMDQCQNNPNECHWDPLSRPPQCKTRSGINGFVYKSKPKTKNNIFHEIFHKYKPEIDEIIKLSY